MHPVVCTLGGFTVYTYGVLVAIGVLAGYWTAERQARRECIRTEAFTSIAFWTILGGFFGAKLLYVALEWEYFLSNPWFFLRSGFVFYGGILAGSATCWLMTRIHHVPFLRLADSAALGIPLGHAFGRIGCFFYGCCYGIPTDSVFGVQFPPDSPAGLSRHPVIPTQLISSMFLLFLFFVLFRVRKQKKFHGQLMLGYLLGYSLFRFLIEFVRGDPRGYLGPFSTSQIIACAIFAVAAYLWPKLRRDYLIRKDERV
ncbi:MAG: prolipoprotein diacylglyceryl transferase [Candidatus Omnitrophica bacterium]|nr:prolipoprotein diacylglyceryl transferase [Candidatus Omnitrophota bacterium]